MAKKTDLARFVAMIANAHNFLLEEVIVEEEGMLVKQLSIEGLDPYVRFIFTEKGEFLQTIVEPRAKV